MRTWMRDWDQTDLVEKSNTKLAKAKYGQYPTYAARVDWRLIRRKMEIVRRLRHGCIAVSARWTDKSVKTILFQLWLKCKLLYIGLIQLDLYTCRNNRSFRHVLPVKNTTTSSTCTISKKYGETNSDLLRTDLIATKALPDRSAWLDKMQHYGRMRCTQAWRPVSHNFTSVREGQTYMLSLGLSLTRHEVGAKAGISSASFPIVSPK